MPPTKCDAGPRAEDRRARSRYELEVRVQTTPRSPYETDIEEERLAAERVRDAIVDLAGALAAYPSIWGWGDGQGGYVMWWMDEALAEVGLSRKAPKREVKHRVPPPIPWSSRYAVMERDGFRCLGCGVQKDLTMDHDVPVSRGGGDEIENLQTLCRPCNSAKGTKTNAEWLAWKAAR